MPTTTEFYTVDRRRFRIFATAKDGAEFFCFSWCRDAASGIERAKADAIKFDRADLHDFRAVSI
jgi:hypothetical protein